MTKPVKNELPRIENDYGIGDAKWMLVSVAMTGVLVFGTGMIASVLSA